MTIADIILPVLCWPQHGTYLIAEVVQQTTADPEHICLHQLRSRSSMCMLLPGFCIDIKRGPAQDSGQMQCQVALCSVMSIERPCSLPAPVSAN